VLCLTARCANSALDSVRGHRDLISGVNELVVLVQSARGTHIVEMLDDVVYENAEKEWGIYRIVKAVWRPPKGVDWWNLPHQKEIFGVEHLPQNGLVHKVPTDGMLQSQYWKDVDGLQGFQQNLSKLLTQISQVELNQSQ
jgi:hypothetical protein